MSRKYVLRYARLVILEREVEAASEQEAFKESLRLEREGKLGLRYAGNDTRLAVKVSSEIVSIDDYDQIFMVRPFEAEGENTNG